MVLIILNKELVPGSVAGIKGPLNFPKEAKCEHQRKYQLHQGSLAEAASFQSAKRLEFFESVKDKQLEPVELPESLQNFELVAGSDCGEIYFDHDWGFFAAVLACYNNHWVLRTSPDDWWNIIVRNIAQAVNENLHKETVGRFFHTNNKPKKTIQVQLLSPISTVDYSWLFDQFSEQFCNDIKIPKYVDNMEANFSTTTCDQLLANQVMFMSSLQKYFDFKVTTKCGVPGVVMKGSLQDWILLLTKFKRLKKCLKPIKDEIGLTTWFKNSHKMFKKLLESFKRKPDRIWWSHILDWHSEYGSGSRSFWTGWMVDFLLPFEGGENPQNFRSGTNCVPLIIQDGSVEDVGKLIAGTFGFSVVPGKYSPVVEAKQGWLLYLPKDSPLIPQMKFKF